MSVPLWTWVIVAVIAYRVGHFSGRMADKIDADWASRAADKDD